MKLPLPPLGNNYRVLVVEDDTTILNLLSMHLAKMGLQCRQALNGAEGWKLFTEYDPHLVLTDITMPGMSGHELTAKIRSISAVPIIIMTAEGTGKNEIEGFKGGADDFVVKPFNPQLLVARVAANLRRVYRYDGPLGATAIPNPSPFAANEDKPVPDGWSQCDNCGYMGPQFKFEANDAAGNRIMVCPHCKHTSVTFSLG